MDNWTTEAITELLRSNNRAVERAIVAIFNRQTNDEKSIEATRHSNSVGFSASDARRGTYYAKWILSGKHLSGPHLDKARGIAIKYRGQLADIAASKSSGASKAPKASEATEYRSEHSAKRATVGCCDGCRQVKDGIEYSHLGTVTLFLCHGCN